MSITDEKYVLISTFRKNGDAVSSPVWIVALADGTAGFTTDEVSGKVKRMRNNSKVTLQPCNMKGTPKAGSAVVEATAEVLVGAQAQPVRDAVNKKYSVMTKFFKVSELWRKVRRKPEPATCAVRLTLA
jgi:PPOX class probable F420-dependent enzyme